MLKRLLTKFVHTIEPGIQLASPQWLHLWLQSPAISKAREGLRPSLRPAQSVGAVTTDYPVDDLESVRHICITRLGMTSMRNGQLRAAVSALIAAHCELDAPVSAHAVPLCRMCAKRLRAPIPGATVCAGLNAEEGVDRAALSRR